MNGYALYRKAWRFEGAPHLETHLEKQVWKALLKQGGLMVRNTYDFDCKKETNFWYVIKDHFEGLIGLSPRVRNKVKHAFAHFDYRMISMETMRKQAYPIVEETFADYAVHDREMNHEVFNAYLDLCAQQSFDFWGIFEKENGQIVGFCTVKLWDNCCEYGLTGIKTEYKRNGFYPYYGLYHQLNRYYLEEQHFNYVSDSARTITEHSQIQDYLIQNFNFRKAYCQLEVHYQWWMKLAVKMLYPFRKVISLPRVKAILNMEAMQRGEK